VRAHDSDAPPAAPKPSDKVRTGPSLAPVTMAAPKISETPTPAPLTTLGDRSQMEKDMETADRLAQRGARRWLKPAALGAGIAVLLFTVFFKATRGSSTEVRANDPMAQFVGVPALTRPDLPSPPAVALAPLEPFPRESAQLAEPASTASKKVPPDTASAHGSPAATVGRSRSSATPARPTKHVADPAAPATVVIQPSTPSVASNGGQVDPSGGKMPMRPIETRDPYGSR
jgi:hypothetical protein